VKRLRATANRRIAASVIMMSSLLVPFRASI
jgi:hypothetical protein